MNYKAMLKLKTSELKDVLKKQFAPRADRRAFESAIDNTNAEIAKLQQEIDIIFGDNIGNFAEILKSEIPTKVEVMRKKKFAVAYLIEKYADMFDSSYVPFNYEEDDYEDVKP